MVDGKLKTYRLHRNNDKMNNWGIVKLDKNPNELVLFNCISQSQSWICVRVQQLYWHNVMLTFLLTLSRCGFLFSFVNVNIDI